MPAARHGSGGGSRSCCAAGRQQQKQRRRASGSVAHMVRLVFTLSDVLWLGHAAEQHVPAQPWSAARNSTMHESAERAAALKSLGRPRAA